MALRRKGGTRCLPDRIPQSEHGRPSGEVFDDLSFQLLPFPFGSQDERRIPEKFLDHLKKNTGQIQLFVGWPEALR